MKNQLTSSSWAMFLVTGLLTIGSSLVPSTAYALDGESKCDAAYLAVKALNIESADVIDQCPAPHSPHIVLTQHETNTPFDQRVLEQVQDTCLKNGSYPPVTTRPDQTSYRKYELSCYFGG